jgi:hypothetical protein
MPTIPPKQDPRSTLPDLARIQETLAPKRHKLQPGYQPETCRDQLRGAWYGLFAGSLWGRKVKPFTRQKAGKIALSEQDYSCTEQDFASPLAAHVTTDAAIATHVLLREKGFAFQSGDVLAQWLAGFPYGSVEGANRVAYRNAVLGLSPPETATRDNPYGEDLGAMLRGCVWGFPWQGAPTSAAAMAWRDARASHTENGLYAAMFFAALLAAASATATMETAVEAALDEIPPSSLLHETLTALLRDFTSGAKPDDLLDTVHNAYDETDAFQRRLAITNAAVAVIAMLGSSYHAGKAIRLASRGGFCASYNAAAAGAVVGMMTGASHIEQPLKEPLAGGIPTTLNHCGRVFVDDLVSHTIDQMGLVIRAKPLLRDYAVFSPPAKSPGS